MPVDTRLASPGLQFTAAGVDIIAYIDADQVALLELTPGAVAFISHRWGKPDNTGELITLGYMATVYPLGHTPIEAKITLLTGVGT